MFKTQKKKKHRSIKNVMDDLYFSDFFVCTHVLKFVTCDKWKFEL